MHNFYHAMHARLYQLKSYLCSQLWFPTVQDVLHADWQDVWHSPQPPFFMLFFSVLALSVFTCFISMSSFIFLVYKVLQIISYVARLCKYFNLWRHICPPWFIWIEQECTQVFYHGKISYPDSAPFCPLLLRGNCYLSASARVWDVPFSVG